MTTTDSTPYDWPALCRFCLTSFYGRTRDAVLAEKARHETEVHNR